MKTKLSPKFSVQQSGLREDDLVFEIKETRKGDVVSSPFLRIDESAELGSREVHFLVSPQTAAKLVKTLTKALKRTRK